jgi:hypothetical protein
LGLKNPLEPESDDHYKGWGRESKFADKDFVELVFYLELKRLYLGGNEHQDDVTLLNV